MLIASTARAQCILDVQGADDLNGQKDLNQLCFLGTCSVTNTQISWALDDTNWTGNNTGDACAMFDTDGDGNANRSVCVTVEGAAVMQAGNPKCYTCGDARPDRCTASTLVACTSTCAVTLGSDPFALVPTHVGGACTGTNCRTLDATSTCCLTSADKGGSGGVFIEVCSFPSQQPNSNPSDCIVTAECDSNNPNDPACNDSNPCTVDTCGSDDLCRHVAGNSGAQCRAPAGACDAAEVCNGTSNVCPPDVFATGGVCRNASDFCDVAESCDGTSADCPADAVRASGFVCRTASGGVCDVAEVCDGVSKACPPNGSQPNTTPCDDGDACTTNDHCDGAGGCAGGPALDCDDDEPCTDDGCNPMTGCTHVDNNDPCSDGSECTTNDACAGGTCVGGPPPDCNDNEVCTTDSCNPMSGCAHAPNMLPCSDGSDCTTNDTCSGNSCVGGPPPDCDDHDVCTTDGCDPMSGCTHTDNSAPCDDGSECTVNDTCSMGDCDGAPRDCDDLNACTDDGCDPMTGCTHVANNDPCDDGSECTTNDACADEECVGGPPPDCNDGKVCTDDSCDPMTGCVNANNTEPCSDGDACTTNDACAGGVCVGGPQDACDDTNACTTDSCISPTGCDHQPVDDCCNTDAECVDTDECTTNERCENHACVSDPVGCDDGKDCTDDGCDPMTGCTHVDNADPCDDGSACTTGDACAGGICVGGPPPNCNDGKVCTDDSCDPMSGCVNANNTAPCDDGNACTTGDACSGGICVGGPPPNCDDGKVCTDDSCDPMSGCVNANNTAPCDDGDACTTVDACAGGTCVGTTPPNCDDGKLCTDDGCDPMSGCTHVDNNEPCDDGSECTTNDACAGGACVGGPPPNCNDGKVCTDDSCDPMTGCVNANNTAPCDDGNECTMNDMCAGGTCAPGSPRVCVDGDPCTDDTCDPSSGCVYPDNTAPCDDGNPCTEEDACAGGDCAPGAQKNCDDFEGCTTDSCNPFTGMCEYVDNSAPCDDGNVCTDGDICFEGACQPGDPKDCGDGNACTTDTCAPMTDCQHAPKDDCCTLDSECTDTDFCTTNERCEGNKCVSDPRDCADQDACTVDICNNAGGGFLCTHPPCYEVQGQPCPDPSCIPPPGCGDTVVDAQLGETCDPPGSTPAPGSMCRLDCTYCGDGTQQAQDGETCDDGNKVEGCIKNDSFAIDDCRNDCKQHICRDPTKAILQQYIDGFTFHGRLTGGTLDFSSANFAVELRKPSGDVIYRTSLPAGSLEGYGSVAGGRYRYTNRAAKKTGGISKMKVRRNGEAYRTTVHAYGNLLGVQTDMTTRVHAGGTEWSLNGVWQKRGPRLWRYVEPK